MPAGAAEMLRAWPRSHRASASKSNGFLIGQDYYTPGTHTAAPHTLSSKTISPQAPGPGASPRAAGTHSHDRKLLLTSWSSHCSQTSPHQTSLSNIRFPPSTAQAAPSSFTSSASSDPHSHASPALFATNTLLMQGVPCTERQPHRLVICKAASHPPPSCHCSRHPLLPNLDCKPLQARASSSLALGRATCQLGRLALGQQAMLWGKFRVWRDRVEREAPKAAQSVDPAQGLPSARGEHSSSILGKVQDSCTHRLPLPR